MGWSLGRWGVTFGRVVGGEKEGWGVIFGREVEMRRGMKGEMWRRKGKRRGWVLSLRRQKGKERGGQQSFWQAGCYP